MRRLPELTPFLEILDAGLLTLIEDKKSLKILALLAVLIMTLIVVTNGPHENADQLKDNVEKGGLIGLTSSFTFGLGIAFFAEIFRQRRGEYDFIPNNTNQR